MLYGIIAAIVAALGFLVMWLVTQQKVTALAEQSAKEANETEARIRRLNDEVAEADARASSAVADLGDLKSEKHKLTSEVETVTGRLSETQSTLEEVQLEAKQLSTDLDNVTIENGKLSVKLDEYKRESNKLQEREALEALSSDTPIRATTLWDLELTRTVRTWRTSVATNPAATQTPLDESDDALRTAVEIEAAALREDVGASVRVDWKTSVIEDAARKHLVLRLAQEMMATAARQTEPTKLIVEGEDELSLRIELDTEADDSVITLSPPKIDSDLIDISSDRGLVVTLRAMEEPTL